MTATTTFDGRWEAQPELASGEGEQFLGLIRRFAPHVLAAIMATGQPNAPVVKAATQIARTYAERERRRAATQPIPQVQTSAAGREFEFEGELEYSPARRVYPDALMEHFALVAAESENEEEAEAFIGALIPLAAKLLPRLAPAVMRVLPRLIQGAGRAARVMRASGATRPLVRTLPVAARNTMRVLQAQAQRGRPITPQGAARTLAAQTARVLGQPRLQQAALRQSIRGDQRYHQAMGTRCGCQAAAPVARAAQPRRCPGCGAALG